MELQVAPQKGSPVDENWHFVGKMNIDIINYHQIILIDKEYAIIKSTHPGDSEREAAPSDCSG